MSMKRKVTIGMIALLTNMILYTGCSNSNVSLSNSSLTLPEVNETSIAAAIEQSAMEDGGYRFANAEFESQFSVYATYYDAIIKNFAVSSDQQQKAYDLAGLIEFICLVSPDNTNVSKEYCHQLETTLIQLSSEDVSNKIMLQKMALNVFELSKYVVTSEFNQIVMNTLSQSQDESGLFKGGDSNDDLVSFRNTYDAVVLCEGIN